MSNDNKPASDLEALIVFQDGTFETIDPALTVTIDNGRHHYTFNPKLVAAIHFRERT